MAVSELSVRCLCAFVMKGGAKAEKEQNVTRTDIVATLEQTRARTNPGDILSATKLKPQASKQ